MLRIKGIRRRWLLNTVGVVCSLGLVCVLVITSVFAAYYYSTMESDMRFRAETTTEFFASNMSQNYNEYYQSCITYAKTFEQRNEIELQFIDTRGSIVASSYGIWAGQSPVTNDIDDAIRTKEISSFVGKDPLTKERIMAVSSPMIYVNGEVIGVLRYVTSTRVMDMQIAIIACIAFFALLVVVGIVLVSSNYYLRSILVPLMQITEKAKMITSGSYGIHLFR